MRGRLVRGRVEARDLKPSPQGGEGWVRGFCVRGFAPNAEPPLAAIPAGERGNAASLGNRYALIPCAEGRGL
jgi:hypothetical protein